MPHRFVGDINDVRLSFDYDIIFSSGTLQYLRPAVLRPVLEHYRERTAVGGMNAFHVFVEKPFIAKAPDAETSEALWRTQRVLS